MAHDDNPPKHNKDDLVHTVIKATLASIPVIGGSAAEFFQFFIQPSIEKRRNDWMENILNDLRELQNNDQINFEELKNNEEFIDIVINTTKIAMSTAHKEKLDALRAALINSALNKDLSKPDIFYFLRLIDELTVWHICILKIINRPADYRELKGEYEVTDTVQNMIKRQYPILTNDILNQMVDDLYRRGLSVINRENLTNHEPLFNTPTKYTTYIGDDFVNYIQINSSNK